MAYQHSGSQPTYLSDNAGRPFADHVGPVEDGWEADGDLVRQAYSLYPEDDDLGQAGTLVREVWNDEDRAQFVETIVGAIQGERSPVLERVFQYWKNVDQAIGERIEKAYQQSPAAEK